MLLDLRVVLAAILATVLLLTAGFSLIAGVRSPLKPSLGFTVSGPPEARALNLPPQASAQPRQLPVLNRTPENIAPANTVEFGSPREKDRQSYSPRASHADGRGQSRKVDFEGPTQASRQAKKKARPVAAPAPKSAFSFGQ